MPRKAVSIKGIWRAVPRIHNRFADDKIKYRFQIYLRTKLSAQHDFINHCVLFRANDIKREVKGKGAEAGYCNKLQITCTRVFHIMIQNQTFSHGLHKPLQLLQRRNTFGELGENNELRSLSFPYFCMSVNLGPLQQSKRKEGRPLR